MYNRIIVFILFMLLFLNRGTSFSQEGAADPGNGPRLEFVREIGGLGADDPDYIMSNIIESCRDENGNLYVLDFGSSRIQVFSPDGTFLRTVGKPGQGPGEFEFPDGFFVSGANIYVNDYRKQAVLLLDMSGNELKRIRYHQYKKFKEVIPVKSGILLSALEFGFGQGGADIFLPVLPKHFTIIDTVGAVIRDFVDLLVVKPEKGRKYYMVIPEYHFTVHSGKIYCAGKYKNVIIIYSLEGRQLSSFTVPVPYKVEAEYHETIRNRKWSCTNLVSRGIGVDGRGRIWLAKYLKQCGPVSLDDRAAIEESRQVVKPENAVFEIYTAEGRLSATVPLPCNIRQFSISGSIMDIIDGDRVSVREYRIIPAR